MTCPVSNASCNVHPTGGGQGCVGRARSLDISQGRSVVAIGGGECCPECAVTFAWYPLTLLHRVPIRRKVSGRRCANDHQFKFKAPAAATGGIVGLFMRAPLGCVAILSGYFSLLIRRGCCSGKWNRKSQFVLPDDLDALMFPITMKL